MLPHCSSVCPVLYGLYSCTPLHRLPMPVFLALCRADAEVSTARRSRCNPSLQAALRDNTREACSSGMVACVGSNLRSRAQIDGGSGRQGTAHEACGCESGRVHQPSSSARKKLNTCLMLPRVGRADGQCAETTARCCRTASLLNPAAPAAGGNRCCWCRAVGTPASAAAAAAAGCCRCCSFALPAVRSPPAHTGVRPPPLHARSSSL